MWFIHDIGGWWWLLGGIWMFIFWGGLIALFVWGVTRLTKRDESIVKHTPLELAKERYAKGEINKNEYVQYRRDLL